MEYRNVSLIPAGKGQCLGGCTLLLADILSDMDAVMSHLPVTCLALGYPGGGLVHLSYEYPSPYLSDQDNSHDDRGPRSFHSQLESVEPHLPFPASIHQDPVVGLCSPQELLGLSHPCHFLVNNSALVCKAPKLVPEPPLAQIEMP